MKPEMDVVGALSHIFLPVPEQKQSLPHPQRVWLQEESLADGALRQERAAARAVLLRKKFKRFISPL